MRAHLAAIKARLETTNRQVHVGHATKPTYPYFIVSAPGWGDDSEESLGTWDVLDTMFRVKAVGLTTDSVLSLLEQARSILSPERSWARLTVTGRSAQTKWERSEFVAPDTSVTFTDGSNPTQGVDTYRLHSQRIA